MNSINQTQISFSIFLFKIFVGESFLSKVDLEASTFVGTLNQILFFEFVSFKKEIGQDGGQGILLLLLYVYVCYPFHRWVDVVTRDKRYLGW